jgi:hypothetical protein
MTVSAPSDPSPLPPPPSCPYVLLTLRHLAKNQTLAILATHLKAKSSLENETIRRQQVSQLLELIDQARPFDGCVFVGDLNADCHTVRSHSRPEIPPETVNSVLDWKENYFYSAYPLPLDEG